MLPGCATAPHALPPVEARPVAQVYRPPSGIMAPLFAWPVSGEVISLFGSKVGRIRNKGIDIRADAGASVRAARPGRVVFRDTHFRGFGKTVILDHGDNYQTVYGYNSEITVDVGDTVSQNDVIAKVGRTGRARETSLHFEIRKNSEPLDPLRYLR